MNDPVHKTAASIDDVLTHLITLAKRHPELEFLGVLLLRASQEARKIAQDTAPGRPN